jgi:hypothetical protein
VTAQALVLAVTGTITFCTSAVETIEERPLGAWTVQALNLFLSQCLSAKVENPMVPHDQLPEWQQKSLSRLPDLYTADSVPNSEKMRRKMAILESY